jgi:multiple sugar transport system substrate-binding protein
VANIDRNSPIPIYHQLKTLIQEQVESGKWRPGDRIPTEQELCQLYDISRSPVRQALQELTYDGLLTRRPGSGTFVSAQVMAAPLSDTPIRVLSSDSHWSKVLDRASQAWNAEHPNQRIVFRVDVVSHDQLYNLLRAAVGSGAAPDVAMVDSVWVAGLAQSGFIYALEGLDSPWQSTEFVQDLYPAFIEANSFNSQLYGLPLKADASLLWYRKDWFAQEGVGPPQNWEDLLTVGKHFLQPHVQERYGLKFPLAFPGGMAGGEATVYNLMPWVWSAGGELFDVETGHVILNAPGTRQALQFIRELVAAHRIGAPDAVNYKWDTTPWLFANGKVAMALGGSYESDVILEASGWTDEEFAQRAGCIAPPAAPGGSSTSTVGGISYVILRQCPSPALVMSILKLAIRPDIVGDLYRSMLQNSACPSFDDFLNPEVEPLMTQTACMIAGGHARPSIPEYFKVSRQLQSMFETVISEATPVEEIVRRTSEFIGVLTERRVRHVQ